MFDIKASDYTEQPNVIEIRRRVSAFDNDEAKAACQILAVTHPTEYFDAMRDAYERLLRDNAEIDAIMRMHRDYIKEVCGG